MSRSSGILLAISLTSLLVFASYILPVRSQPTTIVVPDDFSSIQEAINQASEGDTIYVRNGTYYENIVVNKTVSVIGENRSTTIIDGTTGSFSVYISADNVTFRQFTVLNLNDPWAEDPWGTCIYLSGCRYNIVAENRIVSTNDGIYVAGSDDNAILNNVFADEYLFHGIILSYSNDNLIVGNRQLYLADVAASLWHSCNNLIASNMFNYNMALGMRIEGESNYNVITKNVLTGYGGLLLKDSNGTVAYHNNIGGGGMTEGALSSNSFGTLWDSGYPHGGNYWYWHYEGIDVYSGPYQNVTGSDGIGDTPYVIDVDNTDHYPLMERYETDQHDIGIKAYISKTIIGHGYEAKITTKVVNYGVQEENFNLTFQINTTIQEHMLILPSIGFTTITFTLNTSLMSKGNYSIIVTAIPVINETDTTDNTFHSWVSVTSPGDIDGDQKVDIFDAILLANAFDNPPGDPGWNPNADINGDQAVDIFDAILLANNFDETWV